MNETVAHNPSPVPVAESARRMGEALESWQADRQRWLAFLPALRALLMQLCALFRGLAERLAQGEFVSVAVAADVAPDVAGGDRAMPVVAVRPRGARKVSVRARRLAGGAVEMCDDAQVARGYMADGPLLAHVGMRGDAQKFFKNRAWVLRRGLSFLLRYRNKTVKYEAFASRRPLQSQVGKVFCFFFSKKKRLPHLFFTLPLKTGTPVTS